MTRHSPWVAPLVALCPAIVALMLASCAAASRSLSASGPGSVTAGSLFSEAVGILSSRPMGRDRVDWVTVSAELQPTFQADAPPSAAHHAIAHAVDRLHDPHARFCPPPSARPPAAPHSDEPRAPVQARPIPLLPEGVLLDPHTAYLVVPGCAASAPEDLLAYARSLHDLVARLDSTRPTGWIFDLRLNGGGNLWPMLLGLQSVLPEGVVMTSLDGSTVVNRIGIDPHHSHSVWIDWGRGPETQLAWPPDSIPSYLRVAHPRIAIVMGGWTMSSGEALAISLSASPASRSFGEPSAGLTTGTSSYPLADGSSLILPLYAMGNARGENLSGPLKPDEPVPFGEWPERDDHAVRAARAWLASQTHAPFKSLDSNPIRGPRP